MWQHWLSFKPLVCVWTHCISHFNPNHPIWKMLGHNPLRRICVVNHSRHPARSAPETILQLRITLCDHHPTVWRSILVSRKDTFADLHHYIQRAMGWRWKHSFEFTKAGTHIKEQRDLLDLLDPRYRYVLRADETNLSMFLRRRGDSVRYVYDLWDFWEHQVVVEKLYHLRGYELMPLCIAGQKACPPEDCGGVAGYRRLLQILDDPEHLEYDDLNSWLDEEYADGFDPNKFEAPFVL